MLSGWASLGGDVIRSRRAEAASSAKRDPLGLEAVRLEPLGISDAFSGSNSRAWSRGLPCGAPSPVWSPQSCSGSSPVGGLWSLGGKVSPNHIFSGVPFLSNLRLCQLGLSYSIFFSSPFSYLRFDCRWGHCSTVHCSVSCFLLFGGGGWSMVPKVRGDRKLRTSLTSTVTLDFHKQGLQPLLSKH